MKRLATAASLAAAAILTLPLPAHAENPYPTGDLSTLPACEWNYYRVVSISEGLAHQLGDVTAERDQALDRILILEHIGEDLAHRLGDAEADRDAALLARDEAIAERDALAATVASKDAQIARQAARIERLRARLAGRRAR